MARKSDDSRSGKRTSPANPRLGDKRPKNPRGSDPDTPYTRRPPKPRASKPNGDSADSPWGRATATKAGPRSDKAPTGPDGAYAKPHKARARSNADAIADSPWTKQAKATRSRPANDLPKASDDRAQPSATPYARRPRSVDVDNRQPPRKPDTPTPSTENPWNATRPDPTRNPPKADSRPRRWSAADRPAKSDRAGRNSDKEATGNTDRQAKPGRYQRRDEARRETKPIPPRLLAAQMVQAMLLGKSLSSLLATELARTNESDRSLTAELVQGVARWGHRLRAIEAMLLDHPIADRHLDVEALLLVGLYQLEYLRVPVHAAVSETVQAAGGLEKPWARGLINGVLRNQQRRRTELHRRLDEEPAQRLSYPDWLVERMQAAWPQHWESILENGNARPPMVLRVNPRRQSVESYRQQLLEHAMPVRPVPGCPTGLRLDRPVDVWQLPGFGAGSVSVQDGAAQLASRLLGARPGDQILDACAAPGGKTAHLLETTRDLQVTALDLDAARLKRVKENLSRLKLKAEVVQGDAAKPAGPWAERSYDRILLDLPCSATGVIRRHPDIKWLRRTEDIDDLVAQQRRILDAIWPLLKADGTLLYVTCSILPEENQQQILAFLERQADARLDPIELEWGQALEAGHQILPGDADMDGFFYARLRKAPATVD